MDAARGARRIPWAALALVAVVSAVHLGIRAAAPAPRFWGDESHYGPMARQEAREGKTSLLPGTLGFDHQPLFGVRVLARQVPDIFGGATRLNVALLALAVLATYASGRILGLTEPGALAAAALLGTFPWLGFHVHSLWPEILHTALLSVVFTCLFAHLDGGRLAWLVPAGIATAYALFTKSALAPFVPLFVLFLAAVAWRASRRSDGLHLARVLAPALYALAVALVLAPQLVRNVRAGHGPVLAANRWWNLEVGLSTDERIDDVNERYFASSPDPTERERLARARTLEHARALGVPALLRQQAAKLGALLFTKPSEFEASLHREKRWGDPPPRWLAALELPARVEWYALLGLGLLGAVLCAARSSGWLLLVLYAAGYLAALYLVPVKPRFALPLVPALCLFAGASLEVLGGRAAGFLARRRRAREAHGLV